jgi:2-methylcitrate dehydratase
MPPKTVSPCSCAQTMADFAFRLSFDSIPQNVMAAVRRHLADSVACALGAYNTVTVQGLRKYALETGGRAEATVLGTSRQVPAPLAALVNGVMVRYLDANDIFVAGRGGPSGHFSDGTPGIVALAEKYQASGEELLTCLTASYELQGALSEACNFWDYGFHALTNVVCVLPIIAARLSGARVEQAVHACGLAIATGMVINTWLKPEHVIPQIKNVGVGLALERALEAAELARLGITANEDALESAFWRPGIAESGIDLTRMDALGSNWTTTRNMIKAYPAQLYTQAAVEAVLKLYDAGLRADNIRKLTLYGHRRVCSGVQGSEQAFAPSSRETADHSTPYVMALALLRGRLTSAEYENEPWTTSEVKAVLEKIVLVEEPERNRALDDQGVLGVRLVAEPTAGRAQEVILDQPRGHPDAPLNDAELLHKLTWLLEGIAPAHTATRLLELCYRLSSGDDVKQLIAACNVAPQRD